MLLGAALLYHALNGLRIIIIDLWPAMTVHHRKLWWASWVIFVGLGLPGAVIILRPLWKGILGLVHPGDRVLMQISQHVARPLQALRQPARGRASGT